MSKELHNNTTLSHYRIVAKLGAGGMGAGFCMRKRLKVSAIFLFCFN